VLAVIALWVSFGVHTFFTFFALCACWGLILYMIADRAQVQYAIKCLIEFPEVFNRAIAEDRIMILRRDQ